MTATRTDDTRIEQSGELLAPMQIMRELRASEAVHAHVGMHAGPFTTCCARGRPHVHRRRPVFDPRPGGWLMQEAEAAGRRAGTTSSW
jgi:hypothetical protein